MVRDANISPPVMKFILWVIADIAHEGGGGVFCSHAYIRHCTGYSISTIQKNLVALRDMGLLKWKSHKGKTNNYTLGVENLENLRIPWSERKEKSQETIPADGDLPHRLSVTTPPAVGDVTPSKPLVEPKEQEQVLDVSASAPAVMIFRHAYHRTPDEAQRRQIVEAVGDDLDRWKAYVDYWVGKGYSVYERKKLNVATLLRAFTERNADRFLVWKLEEKPIEDVPLIVETVEEYLTRRANAS
jgi:hypothetical protein